MDYHDFFAATATICAGLWIIYPTVIVAITTIRAQASASAESLLWVPVVIALQAGSYFAQAMIISLAKLLPAAAYPLIQGSATIILVWLAFVPVVVAGWRYFAAVKGNHTSGIVGLALFATLNSFTTTTFFPANGMQVSTALDLAARSVFWLLALGIIAATVGTFVVYQVARQKA